MLQYRHYEALLDIFKLKPTKDSGKEFGDLVLFLAQTVRCYPGETGAFTSQIMELLDTHYALLDSSLRKVLVQSLILMRNKSQVEALAVLPLFFRLFRCQDKQLRQLLFRHIVTDIKNNNKHTRNEKLNKGAQNFMYGVIEDDNEASAKKSLAVCIELWRKHVWRDARTVNVIATAVFHKSSRVMLGALNFFLGQDAADEGGSDGEGDDREKDREEEAKAKMPSKEDVYKAMKTGTRSSKRKKQAKIQRVLSAAKKTARKGQESHNESFAALHLLHDPQTFAEKLFARMQTCNERFETRMAMIQVASRVIGVHKLLVLNFYPYLQKYVAPHQRDVTVILAALVMACHELVPPDTLAPVLKQLVDQFVHDKARPEVMTVGLKTVRELCLRTPLVMDETLLQDLVLYRKFRDKEVSNAARGLIGLFRELNPAMLAKRDRGRGADLASKPKSYGEVEVRERVDGAELLEAAIAAGQGSEDDDYHVSSGSGSEDDMSGLASGDFDEEDEGEKGEGEEKEGGEAGEERADDEDMSIDSEDLGSEDDEGAEPDEEDEDEMEDEGDDEGEEEEEEEEMFPSKGATPVDKKKLDQTDGSLASLKRQLAEAQSKKAASRAVEQSGAAASEGPLEGLRILTEEDFARIKKLKQKALIESSMSKHGMATASKAKRKRLLEAAEKEADEVAELQSMRAMANETRLNPDDLEGRHKKRLDKEERLASVMLGREGREKFGASTGRKKQKTGGLTEKEKQKKKAMPIAARLTQINKRSVKSRKLKACTKNFKGKKAREFY